MPPDEAAQSLKCAVRTVSTKHVSEEPHQPGPKGSLSLSQYQARSTKTLIQQTPCDLNHFKQGNWGWTVGTHQSGVQGGAEPRG